MKHFLLSLIFACVTTAVFAQTGSLSGRVTDKKGEPIPFATVTLKEINKSAVTKNDGRYEITGVAYGRYTLVVTSIGVKTETLTVKVSGASQTVNVKVEAASAKELNQVLVQGKTEKARIETSGFAVNVIDTKEASLRNLQTNELLNRTVGVKVRQSGGIGSDADYNLNGMSGRAIGVFIDGIEISTYGSSFNLNNIPPAMIERIEIYKGVLPAHLSGDFLGGGINVILRKGGIRNSLVASASYGSFNTQQGDIGGSYRDAKTGFTFRGSGFYTYSDNDYEVWSKFVRNEQPNGQMTPARGKRFNDAYRSYGGRAEAGFNGVKWADALMVNYNYSHVYDEVMHGQYMSRPYMGRFTRSNANIVGLEYRKNDLFIKGLNFNFNGVYSQRKQYIEDTVSYRYNWDGQRVIGITGFPLRSLTGAQQGAPTMNTIDRQITTLRSSLSYNIVRNHKLVLNHMYYIVDRQDFDILKNILDQSYLATSDLTKNVTSFNYEAETFNGRLTTNLFAKHYQQKIDRTDPTQQNVGGQPTRVERITTDNRSAVGYGLATSFAVVKNFVLLASAERAVRMPGESEIFGNQADNLLPNVTIRPEFSDNYNVGFRGGPFKLNNHSLSVSSAVFLRNTKDKVVQLAAERNVSMLETTSFGNLNGVRTTGFEAEVNYIHRNLNVILNTTRLQSPLVDSRLPARDGVQIPNEPTFISNANVQYRFNDLLQKRSVLNVYYNFGHVGPFRTIFQDYGRFDDFNITPRQFVQDAGASYRMANQRVVISFDAKNIFNAEAYDNFAAQKPGRAFYIKLNYLINNF
ncbi:TonB-dependent receptor [Mucilaginibacter myungsuensis]|uniref:TonB-dependent receptor n=1 Tax=Mucilaginibacter myungsuensis TaxID=649104 RepID=A0A929PY13_9SPHI|nr:TonB-dependent receptor [Mucilaginibacter myungsuensis]MBE9663709.1 TonB-dependent receptor [Mucilaginibacter myungsuensis]MDN3598967.1 TonB-dependent receptor [Mucilaginibacter myungsuensis]